MLVKVFKSRTLSLFTMKPKWPLSKTFFPEWSRTSRMFILRETVRTRLKEHERT